MDSLFDDAQAEALVSRIHSLHGASAAHWGKMNVEEMLAHCNLGMEMGLERLKLKRVLPGYLFGWLGKRMALGNEKPFSKNLPTHPRLVRPTEGVDAAKVEEQKARLEAAIHEFRSRGAAGVPKGPHPFFGQLEPGQWDNLMAKHLDHHLRQFGA